MNMTGQGGLILGVDVGATTIAGGLVDPAGTVVTARAVPTGRLGRGEPVLRNLLDVVGTLQEEARSLRRAILGIGIGVPGVVDMESGAIGEDIYKIPEFRALPLGRLLGERTGTAGRSGTFPSSWTGPTASAAAGAASSFTPPGRTSAVAPATSRRRVRNRSC